MFGSGCREFIFDNDDKRLHVEAINFIGKVEGKVPLFMRKHSNAYSASYTLIFRELSNHYVVWPFPFIDLQNASSHIMGGRASSITYDNIKFPFSFSCGWRYGDILNIDPWALLGKKYSAGEVIGSLRSGADGGRLASLLPQCGMLFGRNSRLVCSGIGLLPGYLQNVGHVFRLVAAGSPCDNKERYRRNRQNGCEYGEPKSIGGDSIVSRLGMRNIIAFVCSALFTVIVLLIFACANRKRINRKREK